MSKTVFYGSLGVGPTDVDVYAGPTQDDPLNVTVVIKLTRGSDEVKMYLRHEDGMTFLGKLASALGKIHSDY